MSAILLCLVLAVPDGDSMRVKCDGRAKPLSVRLVGSDAPELAHPAFRIAEQPYGRQSQQSLSALCYGQQAKVRRKSLDRYKRTLATVECQGQDAAAYQVRAGMAWAYLAPKRSPLPGLQAGAQTAHLGLWSAADPVAPSAWRKIRTASPLPQQ